MITGCAANFKGIQIFTPETMFIVHIPPITAFAVHTDDISLHFGERYVVFGCPIGAAPAVTEHVVKLHAKCHFQVHTEIRRQHRTVTGRLFDIIVRVLPDPLEAIVV